MESNTDAAVAQRKVLHGATKLQDASEDVEDDDSPRKMPSTQSKSSVLSDDLANDFANYREHRALCLSWLDRIPLFSSRCRYRR